MVRESFAFYFVLLFLIIVFVEYIISTIDADEMQLFNMGYDSLNVGVC